MRKSILYTRVSTDDQSNERQVSDLTEKANHYGMTIEAIFSDTISGSKSFSKRRGGNDLMEFVESTEGISDIVVSEISRISRDVEDCKRVIRIFTEKGINIFIGNTGLNTLDIDGKPNPMTSFMITVLAGAAEYERELLRQRTRSGMKLAKEKGKQIGRVKTKAGIEAERLISIGTDVKEVIRLTGLERGSVYRIKRKMVN